MGGSSASAPGGCAPCFTANGGAERGHRLRKATPNKTMRMIGATLYQRLKLGMIARQLKTVSHSIE